jgi:hypothetical protein
MDWPAEIVPLTTEGCGTLQDHDWTAPGPFAALDMRNGTITAARRVTSQWS